VRGVASIISRDGGPASAASAAKMRSNTPPADEAVVARLVRAVGRGRIAPAEAVADHRDDPAQHTTVSYARNAMRQRTVRRQAPNLRKRQQNASVSRTGAVGLAMAEPPTHPEPHPPASLRTLIGPEPRRSGRGPSFPVSPTQALPRFSPPRRAAPPSPACRSWQGTRVASPHRRERRQACAR